jgi:hypothetical protein
MKCEDAEIRMIDYLDKTCDDLSFQEMEQHLTTCERCRDELEGFRTLLDPMNQDDMEIPDDSLRINFYHMLKTETGKLDLKNVTRKMSFFSKRGPGLLKLAAAIAILIAGIWIGFSIQSMTAHKAGNTEVAGLRDEIYEMKKLVMLSMLKQDSPSERIQAVNFAGDIPDPDKKMLEALIGTLNHDINVNVRLAAAYSLAKYADKQSVRDSLVASLKVQTEPVIQVVLMNILVENKANQAVEPMRQILNSEKTLKEVKQVAEKGIKILL